MTFELGIKMREIRLGSRTINADSQPYIIAEIGVNHEGSMETAKRLIDLAKDGGADCAKFQTYKASKIAAKNSPAYWDTSKETTTSQHKLFKKYDGFGEAEYVELAEYCNAQGIDFISTPFDREAVEFLDPYLPFYKIASADLTNTPLLRQIAKLGKPVVLSTGASTLEEIAGAVKTLEDNGCKDYALLHCVLNYPCPNENAQLNMIQGLQKAFPDILIGYSDHTLPDEHMTVLTAAWAKGAVILEKHFTHDKLLPGNDHYHAMNVADLKVFKSIVEKLAPAFGKHDKEPLTSEEPAREHARRSIVVEGDLLAGSVISESNITYKRPAHGISPLYWDDVIGRVIKTDLKDDHILQWDDLV